MKTCLTEARITAYFLKLHVTDYYLIFHSKHFWMQWLVRNAWAKTEICDLIFWRVLCTNRKGFFGDIVDNKILNNPDYWLESASEKLISGQRPNLWRLLNSQ